MTPQVVEANPRLADDTGCVAVQRGPLVYCLEEIDQTDGIELSDVALSLGKRPESNFQNEFKGDLLCGIVVLHHTGIAYENASSRNILTHATF
jgi:uncharacterized protein